MKASRRNLKNALARAEKRAQGAPKVSKYAAKRRGCDSEPPSLTLASVEFAANYDFHKVMYGGDQ
jgi:hypothetical protein